MAIVDDKVMVPDADQISLGFYFRSMNKKTLLCDDDGGGDDAAVDGGGCDDRADEEFYCWMKWRRSRNFLKMLALMMIFGNTMTAAAAVDVDVVANAVAKVLLALIGAMILYWLRAN